MKRIFDIAFSLLVLLLTLPLLLVLAICIFLSSPGPIFFSQKRLGQGGRLFVCYKFRTMYFDAAAKLKELLATSPDLKKEWEAHFKLKRDPRITPIGIFLRKTSLDELPQLWNVLKGDLSIVGPRPVVPEEAEKFFKDKATKILSVRPGLTGLWQVSGRSDIQSYQARISLDEFYIDHQSFWLDLQVIYKTIPVVLFAKGAY